MQNTDSIPGATPNSARDRLLRSCIEVFGNQGFEGASTRALAEAAGVNLQSIQYYFGGKEGLYLAAADHIASEISARVGARVGDAQERVVAAFIDGHQIDKQQARQALTGILQAMVELFLDEKVQPWAAMMLREQMKPTKAFHLVYSKVMGPALATIRHLLAVLLEDHPDSDIVRLRALALAGSVLVFRVSHAAVLTQMGWSRVDQDQVAMIQAMLGDIVRSIGPTEVSP